MATIEFTNIDARELDQNMTFSDRIEYLLKMRGCSKAWLAEQLGVSRQALNHILKHNKKPKFVSEIALVFNVNPRWVESGSNNVLISKQCDILPSINVYSIKDIDKLNNLDHLTPVDKIVIEQNISEEKIAIKIEDNYEITKTFSNNTILIFELRKNAKPLDFILFESGQNISIGKINKKNMKFVVVYNLLTNIENEFSIDTFKVTGVLQESRLKF